MFNIDPKKMQAVMKQLGMNQEEIDALRVIIEKPDGKIIIENPSVTKIKMQGHETFQISGDIKEESENLPNLEDDIKTIMEKTGCSEKQSRKALEETGDLAEAIMKLNE